MTANRRAEGKEAVAFYHTRTRDETYFSPELQAKLDKSIQQAEEGKVTILETRENLLSFLEAL
ncbi:hypothetical protein Barb4_01714 [Bacteroidales bacterium Barb4]|nr:hypothetical protein Barb4_01714 [Bacteroidales bacterium Barb4]